MDLHLWVAYLAAAVLIALSPGSGAVLSITHGSQHGVRGASAAIAGLEGGLLAILLVAGLGVGSLLVASERAFWAVKVAGACYLFYLGVQQWRSTGSLLPGSISSTAPDAQGGPAGGEARPSWGSRFLTGFLTNVTNPKGIVFMVAVLPQFIDPARPLALQLLILSVTTLSVDVVVMHGYALFGRALRQLLQSPRAARWQRRIFGGFFMALGTGLLFVQRHRQG